MQQDEGLIKFNEEEIQKYATSTISGTGYLAYRDIEIFSLLYDVNFSKILDLGCGSGRSTQFLSHFCIDISGIDISENMIKIAQNNLKKINFS